jgi:hypothetical protein
MPRARQPLWFYTQEAESMEDYSAKVMQGTAETFPLATGYCRILPTRYLLKGHAIFV